jgi:hypothetical protein
LNWTDVLIGATFGWAVVSNTMLYGKVLDLKYDLENLDRRYEIKRREK